MPDSTWRCERYEAEVLVEHQHEGKNCKAHTLHPDLVPWAMRDSDHEWTATFEIDGTNVQNGENGFSSQELIDNAEGCTKPIVEKVKKIWPGAKVVKNDQTP